MNRFLFYAVLFCFGPVVLAQSAAPFGPRAGIGFNDSGAGSRLDKGIHSAFGWQVEVPFKSGALTGYGEAGVYLLGVEQGIFYPHVWGYFGARYNNVGAGAGPVINAIGFGLGANLYYQFELEKIRIPVGMDFNVVEGYKRFQLFVGFNYN